MGCARPGCRKDDALDLPLNRIGELLLEQGNLPAALESFRASHAIFERLTKIDPGNAGWQRDLAMSQVKIGDVLAKQGERPVALQSYRASFAVRERLANSDPGNTVSQEGSYSATLRMKT